MPRARPRRIPPCDCRACLERPRPDSPAAAGPGALGPSQAALVVLDWSMAADARALARLEAGVGRPHLARLLDGGWIGALVAHDNARACGGEEAGTETGGLAGAREPPSAGGGSPEVARSDLAEESRPRASLVASGCGSGGVSVGEIAGCGDDVAFRNASGAGSVGPLGAKDAEGAPFPAGLWRQLLYSLTSPAPPPGRAIAIPGAAHLTGLSLRVVTDVGAFASAAGGVEGADVWVVDDEGEAPEGPGEDRGKEGRSEVGGSGGVEERETPATVRGALRAALETPLADSGRLPDLVIVLFGSDRFQRGADDENGAENEEGISPKMATATASLCLDALEAVAAELAGNDAVAFTFAAALCVPREAESAGEGRRSGGKSGEGASSAERRNRGDEEQSAESVANVSSGAFEAASSSCRSLWSRFAPPPELSIVAELSTARKERSGAGSWRPPEAAQRQAPPPLDRCPQSPDASLPLRKRPVRFPRPRQSWEFDPLGTPASVVQSHVLWRASVFPGSTRAQGARTVDLDAAWREGGARAAPLACLVPELAFKIGKAPKYGA